MKITLKVMELDPKIGEPVCRGDKLLYAAIDFGQSCSTWVRETIHTHEKMEGPVQVSGFKFRDSGRTKNEKNSLGYMYSNANDVQNNAQGVGLFSLAIYKANGLHLYQDNFLRAMALFAARKSIKGNWINDTDEYVAPTAELMETDEYKEFEADALVYALFHGANNCTSIRNVPFKDTTVDVHNQMFWMSPEYLREIADECHYHEMYKDLRGVTTCPYACNLIGDDKGIVDNCSKEGEELYTQGLKLLIFSMSKRQDFSKLNPEYQLDNWDSGYYQLKHFWRAVFPEEHDNLRKSFKALEKTIIPRVHSLGFLRK